MDMRYGTNNIILYTTGTFESKPVIRQALHLDDPENGKIFTIPVQVRHRNPLSSELYSQIREYVSKGLYTPGIDPVPDYAFHKLKFEISPVSYEIEQRKQDLKDHTNKSRMNLFTQRVTGKSYSHRELELYQSGKVHTRDELKEWQASLAE